MVPIMDKELSNAVENEDYERAKTCTEILSLPVGLRRWGLFCTHLDPPVAPTGAVI